MPRDLQDDNDIQEMESSDISATLDEGQADAGDKLADAQADGAKSSDAQDGDSDASLLSVVRDVVKESRGEGDKAAPASPAEGDEDGQQADETQSKKEQDDENYSDVPFHKHPRFQQLLTKAKTNEADAVRYRNVQNFMDSHGLEAEEGADALLIAATAKTDPAKAWEMVKPWVQNLLIAAGEVLPDDLNQRVQAGELSREAALEVSRLRAQNASVEAKQSFQQQREQRSRAQEHATSLMTAAETWVQHRQARDPNFAAKEPLLMREVAFLQRTEGKPDTVEGVKDQLKRAYDAVNATFRPPAPAPTPRPRPAVRPVMGGQANGNARPAPETTLDIIRAHRRAG